MKNIEIEIYDEIFFKKIFHFRLENKIQSIKILLESIYHLLIYFTSINTSEAKTRKSMWTIIYYKNKMSRIFLISENKMFSINFPFLLDVNNKKIYSKTWNEIDNKILSFLRSIFYDMDEFDIETIVSSFWDNENLYPVSSRGAVYEIVNILLFFEDWYIRYDFDSENENWRVHPLYHYDFFYSTSNQFKIGLKKPITHEKFIDFLDITKECQYLE